MPFICPMPNKNAQKPNIEAHNLGRGVEHINVELTQNHIKSVYWIA